MLVLSRKQGESIVVNNDIVVTVVEVRGDKVKLGIVAPKTVPVHRQEVWVKLHPESAIDGGFTEDPHNEDGDSDADPGKEGNAA